MKTLHCMLQVIELTEYRASLYDYLKHRMMAIAPNVTALVGELVGARLISHAGTVLQLLFVPKLHGCLLAKHKQSCQSCILFAVNFKVCVTPLVL